MNSQTIVEKFLRRITGAVIKSLSNNIYSLVFVIALLFVCLFWSIETYKYITGFLFGAMFVGFIVACIMYKNGVSV